MGRPLNKRHFGDAAGSLQVTAYRRSAGAEITGEDDTYIVSQRSTNKFLIADTSGAWTEVLTLVNKAPGTLVAGEFIVEAMQSSGIAARVTKFYGRKVQIAATSTAEWQPSAAVEVYIGAVTAANPAVVSAAEVGAGASGLSDGDIVRISGVLGMTELNGNNYTIGTVSAAAFTLVGIDSTSFTAYASGGLATLLPSGSIVYPDVQVV